MKGNVALKSNKVSRKRFDASSLSAHETHGNGEHAAPRNSNVCDVFYRQGQVQIINIPEPLHQVCATCCYTIVTKAAKTKTTGECHPDVDGYPIPLDQPDVPSMASSASTGIADMNQIRVSEVVSASSFRRADFDGNLYIYLGMACESPHLTRPKLHSMAFS